VSAGCPIGGDGRGRTTNGHPSSRPRPKSNVLRQNGRSATTSADTSPSAPWREGAPDRAGDTCSGREAGGVRGPRRSTKPTIATALPIPPEMLEPSDLAGEPLGQEAERRAGTHDMDSTSPFPACSSRCRVSRSGRPLHPQAPPGPQMCRSRGVRAQRSCIWRRSARCPPAASPAGQDDRSTAPFASGGGLLRTRHQDHVFSTITFRRGDCSCWDGAIFEAVRRTERLTQLAARRIVTGVPRPPLRTRVDTTEGRT
jgi:hypothetical protein